MSVQFPPIQLDFFNHPEQKNEERLDFPTLLPDLIDEKKHEKPIHIAPKKMSKDECLSRLKENNFVRISKAIEATWGHKECVNYMSSLIVNPYDRGFREGFQPSIFEAILRLRNIHDDEYPKFVEHFGLHKDFF